MRSLKPVPELSKNNHFEFGFADDGAPEGVPFSFRTSDADRWFARYGRCERMPMSFREECLATARLIRESTRLPIDVLFSGGVDSEVAVRSFLEAGIPIRIVTARFAGGLNAHDLAWVEKFARAYDVSVRYVDLDILKFWEGDAFAYADRTQCVSPQLLSTMWLADQCDGFCVLGSGENFIVKRVPSDYVSGSTPYLRSQWDLFEKEKIAAWYRHFITQGRDAAPGFFQYTPELILSWFLDEIGCDLWNDRLVGKLSSVSSKLPIYQRHFDVATREKFTGFERVQEQDALVRRELRKKFDHGDHIVKTPVPWLVRSMMPFGFEDQTTLAISEFSNPDWGEEVSLSGALPGPTMIDGRIYYT